MSAEPRSRVRLGVLSDIHFIADPDDALAYHNPFDVAGVLPRLREAVGWFQRERVDAVAVLGDLTHDGEIEATSTVLRALAEGWAGPAFVVPGNHDLLIRADVLAGAGVVAPDVSVPPPEGSRFRGVLIAAVDPRGPLSGAPTTAWGDDPVVLLSHWPVISRERELAERCIRYAGDLPGLESWVTPLLARAAPTVILHGHLHVRDSVRSSAVAQLSVAALVEPPFEASIVEVEATAKAATVHRVARSIGAPTGVRGPVLVPADEVVDLPTSLPRSASP